MNLLIIDNYDSFVYNIIGLLRGCHTPAGHPLRWDIVKNDRIPLDTLHLYDAIILSPGPGIPSEAGDLMRLVSLAAGRIPMLGMCLGHQAIAQHYGAQLLQLVHPRHGHPSPLMQVDITDPVVGPCADGEVTVGRYHSWTVDDTTLPSCLLVTARDEEGHIMSLRHRSHPVFGLQFHPESIITTHGPAIIQNFLLHASRF